MTLASRTRNSSSAGLLGSTRTWLSGMSLLRAGRKLCTCPYCGHATLTERGAYEICGECGWEDDGQHGHDSEMVRGGPNGPVSLDAARAAYERRGRTRGMHRPPSAPVCVPGAGQQESGSAWHSMVNDPGE
jgi:Cysteine-rich CPCC